MIAGDCGTCDAEQAFDCIADRGLKIITKELILSSMSHEHSSLMKLAASPSSEARISLWRYFIYILFTFLELFQIREACQDLILDDKTLREIMSRFLTEIDRGLKKDTHPKADIKCFVTYVQDLPNGKGEHG